MSPFQSPNYTQTPNDLFDELLPEMGLAELKVVMCIVRHTFGYHKDDVKLSIRKIARFTGLTAKSVMEGADAAEAHGLIERTTDGNKTTIWRAAVSVIPSSTPRITRYHAGVLPTKPLLRSKESNKENAKEEIDSAAVFVALENLVGSLNSNTPRFVDTWLEKHEPARILQAIEEARTRRARSIKYVDEVLISWEANGYPKTREQKVAERRKPTQPQQPPAEDDNYLAELEATRARLRAQKGNRVSV